MVCSSPSDAEFIDDVARQCDKFDRILKQQSAIFRNNVSAYEAAVERFQQHPDNLVQPGWDWPQPGEVELYLNKCESICQMEPLDFDEFRFQDNLFFRCVLLI